MKKRNSMYAVLFSLFLCFSCSEKESDMPTIIDDVEEETEDTETTTYSDINFSNWKLTLPVDENNNGSPDEYQPDVLVNGGYRNIAAIAPYMYDDTSDASLVFYTFPASSTTNSSYSRTELRELIDPSNARVNWTLETGGTLRGKLKMMSISEDNTTSRQYHSTIVMQIHGIISIADMARLNLTSNNGPPLIKMRWIDGDLWVYKKSLVNEATSGDNLFDVSTSTWVDEKHNMGTVGFDAFEFSITASAGKIELQLNNETPYVYEDASLAKWPFENYFKAGNYLATTQTSAFSSLKYYNLTVTH
ncbi:polysaccharide lyase family 7 protein [Polaribacter sp.]|nr:polysaccharide lyase family 7 protein [Polaribacter sp.]